MIEIEPVCDEAAEIEGWQLGDGLQQCGLLARRLNACESQMRRIGARFFRYSERSKRCFGISREAREIVVGMNPGPEDARRMRVWEKAQLLDGNGNRRTRG